MIQILIVFRENENLIFPSIWLKCLFLSLCLGFGKRMTSLKLRWAWGSMLIWSCWMVFIKCLWGAMSGAVGVHRITCEELRSQTGREILAHSLYCTGWGGPHIPLPFWPKVEGFQRDEEIWARRWLVRLLSAFLLFWEAFMPVFSGHYELCCKQVMAVLWFPFRCLCAWKVELASL